MEFYETSAKTGNGVEEAFSTVAKKLMLKKQQAIAEKKEKSRQKPGISSNNESKLKEENKIALEKTKEPQKEESGNCNC